MKMKKTILLALLALFTVTFAKAQSKPPTLPEATRDTLYPEIVEYLGFGEFLHFLHPATEIRCVAEGRFRTLEEYQQYQWEVNEEFLPLGGDPTESSIFCIFNHPGYLKVTVWDSIGNSGTDSIWFNIKDWTVPIDDFTMEIDSSNHAVFSGTVTPEQTWIGIYRSLDTINWHQVYSHPVSPGHWTWRDEQVHFSPDSISASAWRRLVPDDEERDAVEQEGAGGSRRGGIRVCLVHHRPPGGAASLCEGGEPCDPSDLDAGVPAAGPPPRCLLPRRHREADGRQGRRDGGPVVLEQGGEPLARPGRCGRHPHGQCAQSVAEPEQRDLHGGGRRPPEGFQPAGPGCYRPRHRRQDYTDAAVRNVSDPTSQWYD